MKERLDDYQLTLKDSINLRCRLWNNCDYHTCNNCEVYHDPRKNPNIDLEEARQK